MSLYLEKAVFHNRAPFSHLELEFNNKNIVLLNAYNGGGKTTIISHIVDAFYEIARPHYSNEFEGKESKFYRVSSSIYNLNSIEPSFVYFRFNFNNEHIDYVDVRNKCTKEQYNSAISLEDKIPFEQISNILSQQPCAKCVSKNATAEKVQALFNSNLATYFPAYRFEYPGFLNKEYKNEIKFKLGASYAGYMPNDIEVVTNFHNLASWMMDVVLDWQVNKELQHISTAQGSISLDVTPENTRIWISLNDIINSSILNNEGGTLRLGIGKRVNPAQRISIMRDEDKGKYQKYPSIFNLSSGETAIITLFGELLHQADNINKFNDISGIVLIDEIDKHLHIKMQKEILPSLFSLFPNIQFIISSHSPFVSMGLMEKLNSRTVPIFLSNGSGIETSLQNNPLYEEVYQMMIKENEIYYHRYEDLFKTLQENTKPLIITEGKTDWMHLNAALDALKIVDIDVEFYKYDDTLGNKTLLRMLKDYSRIPQQRIIIGVFDRDDEDIVKDLNSNNENYFSFGNNVFGFCIPIAHKEEYGSQTSIEHYYLKKDLLKEDANNCRLFLGGEFYSSGNSTDGKYATKCSRIQTKIDNNGIVDEKVYLRDDLKQEKPVALSKSQFAQNIFNKDSFADGFDFSEFSKIFDIIREIIKLQSK
ncbi:MAG: AAA family ATPase [Clostridia bacterium]|nr:AAA family ATPase [Clostridia bacterium]